MAFSPYALFTILSALVHGACAQNFTVPLSWTGPSSALNRNQRIQVAYAANELFLPFLANQTNIFTEYADGTALNLDGVLGLRALTRTDFLAEEKPPYDFDVVKNLTAIASIFFLDNNSVPLTLTGLLAADVFFAYNDSDALKIAERLWNLVYPSQIQPQQASSGLLQFSNTNVSFSPSCNQKSVLGAVLDGYSNERWAPDAKFTYVDASGVGSFLALSSLLYKATKNQMYQESARYSAQFVQNHLTDGQIIQSGIDISNCSNNSTQWPDETGFVLEGLSILNDTEYNPLMMSLISTSILSLNWTEYDGIWTQSDFGRAVGVYIENTTINWTMSLPTTPVYIRGLHEAWATMDRQDPAAILIESFLMVQYNALLVLASVNNTYAANWTGPPPAHIHYPNQAVALDVLNAAIAIGLPATASKALMFKKSVISIVGGVFGSVGALLLLGALMFWRRHRRASESYIRGLMNKSAVPYSEVHPWPFVSAGDRKRNRFRTRHPLTAIVAPATAAPDGTVPPRLPEAVRIVRKVDEGPIYVPELSNVRAPNRYRTGSGDSEAMPLLAGPSCDIAERQSSGGIIEEDPPSYHTY